MHPSPLLLFRWPKLWWRCAVLLLALATGTGTASAYLVGPPLELEKLVAEADVIFKGTGVSSAPVKDDWFKEYGGFQSQETRFTVVSMIKGKAPGPALSFRHYDNAPPPFAYSFQPQHYHFGSEPELHRVREEVA